MRWHMIFARGATHEAAGIHQSRWWRGCVMAGALLAQQSEGVRRIGLLQNSSEGDPPPFCTKHGGGACSGGNRRRRGRALRACNRINRSIRCSPQDTPSASMSCHTRLAPLGSVANAEAGANLGTELFITATVKMASSTNAHRLAVWSGTLGAATIHLRTLR